MNQQSHLSDDVLSKIVSEDRLEANHVEIETHIESCELCQSRLMSLAAGNDWRAEFNDCLSADVLSDASHSTDQLSFLSTAFHDSNASSRAEIHEFDKASIDRMLEQMLSTSKHPETLGSLNRYEVESVIGVGGMGVVLRGYDHDLQRPVAIKTILPRLASNGTAKQRFAREARSVAAILHPNVIAIHDVDESAGIPWFVMPFVAGPSLREMVLENGPLPERDIVRIGLQIASGLAAAHSQGLVHRDIKPSNILVDNRVNRVVITDFGLARMQTEETITQTGNFAGTLNYMSPEQVRGEELDGRSDLFSLGCLLYFLAAGEVPFASERAFDSINKINNQKHSDVRSLNPEISLTLARAIDRLLEKDPEHRFGSAAELEKFFEELVSHMNQPTKHKLPAVPKGAHQRHSGLALMAISLCAILFLAIGSLWAVGKFWPEPANTSEARSLMWSEIQQRYGIESPSELQLDIDRFNEHIRTFESDFRRIEEIGFEGDRFIERAQQIERSMFERSRAVEQLIP